MACAKAALTARGAAKAFPSPGIWPEVRYELNKMLDADLRISAMVDEENGCPFGYEIQCEYCTSSPVVRQTLH